MEYRLFIKVAVALLIIFVFDPKVPICFTELTSLVRRDLKRLNGLDLSGFRIKDVTPVGE